MLKKGKEKKKEISALLKNEERGVTKPLPMGNSAPTCAPSPALTALSQQRSQQPRTGGKCSPESLKYPKFLKKPHSSQSPGGYWIVQGVEVTAEGCGERAAPRPGRAWEADPSFHFG